MDSPRVFVGSSSEGLPVARAIQFLLKDSAHVSIWDQGVFGLSQGNLESLVRSLDSFDFAILVITPDDVVISRNVESQVPRDNVMFELGLFMGRLGRERSGAVGPTSQVRISASAASRSSDSWCFGSGTSSTGHGA